MTGNSNAGIHDDWHGGLLDNDADLVAGGDAAVRANRGTQRHHSRRADFLQALGEHRIGIDVGKDGETLLNQSLGSLQGFDGVGQEIGGIGVDLELHPLGKSGGLGEARESHRLLGVHGTTGVGEDEVFLRVDELEDVGVGIALATEVGTAQGHGHHLGATGLERIAHGFIGRELAGTDKEAGIKGASGDDQWLAHGDTIEGCCSVLSSHCSNAA